MSKNFEYPFRLETRSRRAISNFKLKSFLAKIQIKKEQALFLVAFAVVGFILLQIPVNVLAGSKVKFTLYDLFAPMSGAIVGSPLGIISALAIQVVNIAVHGIAVDRGVLIRLFPTLFAIWYFSKSDKKQLLIPVLAIISFNLNPVGRSVWYYSMFWLIPLIAYPFKSRFLILRALGATFTAHAVGGAVWIWAFHLPAPVWQGLVPVVIMERAIFALGISASFIFSNNLLVLVSKTKLLTAGFSLDRKYLLPFLR